MSGIMALLTPPSHTHRTAEENLGIGYIASILRNNGYIVHIIDAWLEGISIQELVNRLDLLDRIDFIGISCYRSSLGDVAIIVNEIRSKFENVPVIAGGFGPTFYPKDFLDIGVDIVVIGEGEEVILDVLRSIKNKESLEHISGISWMEGKEIRFSDKAKAPLVNLLPFPQRDTVGFTLKRKNPIHILTSRGCNAHCLFCAVVTFSRKMKLEQQWRFRSINNIIDEISELHEKFGVSCFKFVDDSFIEPPRNERWIENFTNELNKRNLKISFRTQVRADRLSDSIVSALVQAGWFATSIGIENSSKNSLERMNKSATLEDNEQALYLLEKYRVFTQMGMILFDNKTTIAELRENYQFLMNHRWPVTKGIFTEMYASQETPFSKLLEKKEEIEGRLSLGGFLYKIRSQESSFVYEALKSWHKSHCEIYDRAINPIGAPKAIEKLGYFHYYELCRLLMDKDLWFFGKILERVEAGFKEVALKQLTEESIRISEKQYEEISFKLDHLDELYGLSYDAFPNPFLQERS